MVGIKRYKSSGFSDRLVSGETAGQEEGNLKSDS